VKVTREQAAENRQKLVRAAGRLIRERGIDGVGVAEICAQAGLTHGALYAQFGSKDALVAEALEDGLRRGEARVADNATRRTPTLDDYLAYYLSEKRRDDLGGGCPMAASASEIARQGEMVSARFGEGFESMVETIEAVLTVPNPQTDKRQIAIAISAAMIGGLAIARGVAKSQPSFSAEILASVADVVRDLGKANNRSRAGRKKDKPARRE
jgi:TetR/AcrR family transcriptional repressor of nem operon